MTRTTGTPTWIDFGSTDMATTKAFYAQLFGWEFEDSGEEMGHYNMIRKDGALVGGGMDVSGMADPTGSPIPSSWTVYLAADDVDARLFTAEQHGAQIVLPADIAGSAGRFALIEDATGALVGLWSAGDVEGHEFSGNPGTPVWFELMSQNFEASKAFYTTVFGCDYAPMGEGYATDGTGENARSGICDAAGFIPAEMGSFWRVYFCVDDCDTMAQKVTELGGRLLDGPVHSPFGRLATVAEPTGATFQIIAPSQAVADGAQA